MQLTMDLNITEVNRQSQVSWDKKQPTVKEKIE
jgi:hypothetical protein